MLSIENLNLHLGQKHVLKNISLDLPFNGEMIGIMGPNGSGKSSLIKSIIGELRKRKSYAESTASTTTIDKYDVYSTKICTGFGLSN